MVFYHGTSKENYEKILKEGVLFGIRTSPWNVPSRCTYLACDLDEAIHYGEIVLEVNYDPNKNKDMNNYCDNCWQLRVYEPIDISDIKLINGIYYNFDNRKTYLVKGELIGHGKDGEPIIKNDTIIKEISLKSN